MRRVGSWGVAAALIVGLGAAVAAADDANGDSKAAPVKSGWWSGLFGDKPKPHAKADKKAEVEPAALPNGAEIAIVEQRQRNAALRRVQVCDRLRQVAVQTGNADLERQVDEMEARAWEVYRQQTAHLPVPTMPTATVKTAGKERETKRRMTGSGATDKDVFEPSVDVKPPPIGTMRSMDGNFDQRERNAVNGTFMGRDKQ
jgi:hypothetical protein